MFILSLCNKLRNFKEGSTENVDNVFTCNIAKVDCNEKLTVRYRQVYVAQCFTVFLYILNFLRSTSKDKSRLV